MKKSSRWLIYVFQSTSWQQKISIIFSIGTIEHHGSYISIRNMITPLLKVFFIKYKVLYLWFFLNHKFKVLYCFLEWNNFIFIWKQMLAICNTQQSCLNWSKFYTEDKCILQKLGRNKINLFDHFYSFHMKVSKFTYACKI